MMTLATRISFKGYEQTASLLLQAFSLVGGAAWETQDTRLEIFARIRQGECSPQDIRDAVTIIGQETMLLMETALAQPENNEQAEHWKNGLNGTADLANIYLTLFLHAFAKELPGAIDTAGWQPSSGNLFLRAIDRLQIVKTQDDELPFALRTHEMHVLSGPAKGSKPIGFRTIEAAIQYADILHPVEGEKTA